ncbi:MAG: hypothetical protein ACT4NY_24910 [Pseudonocardiales bacterium]
MTNRIPPLLSVTVSPEWDSYPLWFEYSREEPRENLPVEVLNDYGVDPSLVASIEAWDEEYQSVFNRDDPDDSGFSDETETNLWISQGVELTKRLSTQLPPGVDVLFRKVGREVRFTSPNPW